jgi:multiple sugar transport system ATP-binding protein
MSVRGNMAFPLKLAGVDQSTIDSKVEEVARVLDLEQHLDRKPANLSGGQRQRVAMGRAIVRSPKAFLMDEPLSNLDAKLRVYMRAELKRFHHELSATVIYVTHDQMEAMTMSDRIVVMNNGLLQQAGTPDELYWHPVNLFVAGFIGSPAMNFLPGRLAREGDTSILRGDGGWEYRLSPELARRAGKATSDDVVLGVRHPNMRLYREAKPGALQARIYTVEPTGDVTFVHVRLGEHILVASTTADFRANADDPVWIDFDQQHLHLFDKQTEESLSVEG